MDVNEKAKELVSQMTLEEKVSLLSGLDCWHTKPVPRLNLPSIMVSDGPHGLRKQVAAQDNFGVGDSIKATCFPTASLSACSFDENLIYKMGQALAEECILEDVSVILGPGINMKRSPLCGRNFEYFSEDPLVSGKLSAAWIKGVQSKGIGTSLKHFAVNNQEKRRMSISAVVDKRTLYEYYLKAFEIAVTEAKPWTVMCSYNKVNGVYASENRELLQDTLRTRWNFKGMTVSDWGAVHIRSKGVEAGLDLEMPGNKELNDKKVLEAVKNGELDEKFITECALRVTELVLKAQDEKKLQEALPSKETLLENHHELAVEIAENSMVLLKNQDNILPLKQNKKIAVIGAFAKTPRYQGAGSSRINPAKLESPLKAFEEEGIETVYAQGYELNGNENQELLKEAVELASQNEAVVLFAGLPSSSETEGMDRLHMKMPENQTRLIEKVCTANPNTVVVLMGGSPFELPWLSKAKAVLLGYLGGQGCGKAIINLLLGKTNPSGKLAETWPVKKEDCLSDRYFPGDCKTVQYRESIFAGYRYFDTVNKEVNFSFGHGLSYTTFNYSNLVTENGAEEKIKNGKPFTISFDITNTGKCGGYETSFVFASFPDSSVFSALHNLAGFKKVYLESGESKTVTVEIDPRELSYFDAEKNEFVLHKGKLVLQAGGSLKNLGLETVLLGDENGIKKEKLSVYDEISQGIDADSISDKDFALILGHDAPEPVNTVSKPYTMDNCLLDAENTRLGKIIKKLAVFFMKKVTKTEEEQIQMMIAAVMEMPFFGLAPASNGILSEKAVKFLVKLLNL